MSAADGLAGTALLVAAESQARCRERNRVHAKRSRARKKVLLDAIKRERVHLDAEATALTVLGESVGIVFHMTPMPEAPLVSGGLGWGTRWGGGWGGGGHGARVGVHFGLRATPHCPPYPVLHRTPTPGPTSAALV